MSDFGGFDWLKKRARKKGMPPPWQIKHGGIEFDEVYEPEKDQSVISIESKKPIVVEWQVEKLPDNPINSAEVMEYMERAKKLRAAGFILRDDEDETVEFHFPEFAD